MLLAEAIDSSTGIAIGLVVTIAVAMLAIGKYMASTMHRLDDLEKAQEADDKWRQEQFQPWRQKVTRALDRLEMRLPRDPDASTSRTWDRTDGH